MAYSKLDEALKVFADIMAVMPEEYFTMDDETKAAIDALLSSSRKRSKPSAVKESIVDPFGARLEEEERRARYSSIYGKPPETGPFHDAELSRVAKEMVYPTPPPMAYKGHQLAPGATLAESTQDETAILSINTAKACVVFRAPMTHEFLDEFKIQIRQSMFKWNKTDGVMEINPSVLPQLKLLLKNHYKDTQVFGVQKQVKATQFDQLMARLTKDDKNKVYRLLAGIYHPDRGGDKETMTLINVVFKQTT